MGIVDYYRYVLHAVRRAGAFVLQLLLRVRPVDRKTVVFYAYDRKGLCCNPKYILNAMLERSAWNKRLFWASDFPATVENGLGYEVLRVRSIRYYFICSRAKLFVINDRWESTLLKRKDQIVLNTWHGGGAYKKAGYDAPDIPVRELKKFYGTVDYMLTSSDFLWKRFPNAFRIVQEKVLRTGMPRNDLLFKNNDFKKKIAKHYSICSESRILLYAPTYRRKERKFLTTDEITEVLCTLTKKFGGNWVCFFRFHQFEDWQTLDFSSSLIMNCNDYMDVQELLCASDALLTDYSSLLWDYSLIKKPIFCYMYDFDQYEKQEREFYLPIKSWPYPKAYQFRELLDIITDFQYERFLKNIAQFMAMQGSLEDGHATERVMDFLETIWL